MQKGCQLISFFNFIASAKSPDVKIRGSCSPFFKNGNMRTEDSMRKPLGGDIIQKNLPIALA